MTIPFDEGKADLLVPKVETWAGDIGRRDYFGMIDGYLVYYDATNRRLLVADFWPSW